ncbi:MAG: ATP:cob(I)alamin adenosyltransferase [Candidatus Fluviicola riflensis]|nr:MAG: ATP:cob(I)alamin adenosyltransferase [Candidatus Fluviicola riflensis]OGS79077.1 MAG: ATP:cob(I)alamin adenosyltransferase [Candidatus Fluviicola riflensis]OGS86100.1 MAG: ATP:cob(I)alamin adenosyltransferase [Fluviicola sp. RIFCSPHIGHO2_12_FULL_43_24]OGS86509.1 MAG: ATP:cob(I)alamin adenosyltransferase [Fluviicola sp. RIFCSPHIGHO2_01_FULL_43_53]
MKIYTKKGDSGTTGLIGGTRLPKHHIRIESYGTVDELNSYIGLLRDLIADQTLAPVLLEIQDRLFTIGSHLAADPVKSKMELPKLSEADVTFLETEIDTMDQQLEPMKFFVLPGGHPTVSHCHIARCVCRRAERLIAHLAENEPVDALIGAYMNRLSDYLFMLSRKLTKDLGAEEMPWRPKTN